MKKVLSLIFVFFVMLITACNESNEFTGIQENLRYSETYQIVSVAPEGVIYKGKDEMIHFRAEKTGEDIILCYDPNCIHEPASSDNPDPMCRAALFENRTHITYYEGNIYYFMQESIYEHKIYKMEVNGAGRSVIAEVPYQFDTLFGVLFYEDKMYYTVVENNKIDDEGTLGQNFYILEYDLKSNDYRVVTPDIEDTIMDMQMTKEYIYIRLADVSDEGKLYVKRYNIETTEEEVFVTTEEYQTNRFLRAYDEHYVYACYLDEKQKVVMRDIKSGKDTVLIDVDKSYELGSVQASGNGILFNLLTTAEDATLGIGGVFFYDILAGETKDITEKALELNILRYDGYKKIFICNTLYNTSVIKEETILGK